MNTPVTTMETQDDLLTISEMSARYHAHRLRFVSRVHRAMMFVVVLIGTAIAARISGEYYIWLGAITSVIVLLELVFDIQGARSLHQNLYRSFTLLSGEIASHPDAGQETVQRWNMRLHELYADEPPVYRALNAHVRNEMAIRLGDLGEVKPLPWWLRLMKNWITFPGYEHKEAAASPQ
ncbi:MAG: hypothetical protein OXU96_02820 [Gammaproteobacteria bacterium]|nr:hypothetical protein [Gammaproteobacteria bacterium]